MFKISVNLRNSRAHALNPIRGSHCTKGWFRQFVQETLKFETTLLSVRQVLDTMKQHLQLFQMLEAWSFGGYGYAGSSS